MKKFLMIPIITVFLTACASVQAPKVKPVVENAMPTIQESKSTQIQEKATTTEKKSQASKQNKDVKTLTEDARLSGSTCAKQGKDKRDCWITASNTIGDANAKTQFLYEYLYDFENQPLTKEDEKFCGYMGKNTKDKAQCYWMIALSTQDQSICNKIATYPKDASKTERIETNAVNCKNEISYKYNDAQWELTGGLPVYGEGGNSFKGNAKVTGWMEEGEYYNEKQLFFTILDNEMVKLPLDVQKYKINQFILVDGNRKQMSKTDESIMKKYTKEKPLTLDITKVFFPSEGQVELTVATWPKL